MVVTDSTSRTVTGVNSIAQELIDACYGMADTDGFEITFGSKKTNMTIREWRAVLYQALDGQP